MKETWRRREAQQVMLDRLTHEDGSEEERISRAAHDAIEMATTVKISQDALDELIHSCPMPRDAGRDEIQADMHEGAVAFLEALGFEVVK